LGQYNLFQVARGVQYDVTDLYLTVCGTCSERKVGVPKLYSSHLILT